MSPTLPDRTIVLPRFFVPLILLLNILVLALPPRPRTTLFITLLIPLYLGPPLVATTGDTMRDIGAGATLGILLFTGLDYYVLTQAEAELWHVRRRRRELRGWERLRWSAGIWLAPRGVGWSFEVKNLPEKTPAGYPRWKFIPHHILRAFLFFLLNDAFEVYMRASPQARDPPAPLLAESYPRQAFLGWLHFIKVYIGSSMLHSTVAAVKTAVGLTEPGDWAPFFGSWADAWSVRNFWGKTWHQMLRRPVSSFGRAAVRFLGFPKGSIQSRYTQLYVGFLASALMHEAGSLFAVHRDLGDMRFFLSQAVAITFEDIVIAVAKKMGWRNGGPVARLVGYLWVFSWMGYSLSRWIAGAISVGAWRSRLFPFSVVEKVIERVWE